MANFKGIYKKSERQAKIDEEYEHIAVCLSSVAGTKAITLEKLLHELAFMTVTLDETRQIIVRDGIIEEYQNGATQKGLKKSSAVEVYDKMMTTFSRTVDQVNKLLPDGISVDPGAELKQFIGSE